MPNLFSLGTTDRDTDANRPAAGTDGRVFFQTDVTPGIFLDDASSWVRFASPDGFTLPAGGRIDAAFTTERFPVGFEVMNAPMLGAGQAATRMPIPYDCTLVAVAAYIAEFSTDSFNRWRSFQNTTAVFDDTGLSFVNGQVYTASPNVDFDEGDFCQVGLFKIGTAGDMFIPTISVFVRRQTEA